MLGPDDPKLVADAIRAAETHTDGEIAVVVAPESDSYHDVVLHWSLLVALLPLAIYATFPGLLHWSVALVHEPWGPDAAPLRLIVLFLLLKTAGGFIVGWLIFRIPGVKLEAVDSADLRHRAQRHRLRLGAADDVEQ